jgi:predicted transposase/invertase (TIGR01784 family)
MKKPPLHVLNKGVSELPFPLPDGEMKADHRYRIDSKIHTYEDKRKKVSQFNLTSDMFFSKVMEDPMACQEVIQIITGVNLIVKAIKTQYSIRNLENHSVVLDVLAEEEQGRMINVEIHPQEDEDHVRRVRFHLSSIDQSFLEKGMSFNEIPDVYLIYITEKDFIGENKGIYVIQRTIQGTERTLYNGVHELYVNLKGKTDKKEQAELLAYMAKSDSNYQTYTFPNLVKRVKLLKENKEGVEIMCEIMERERAEGYAECYAYIIAQIRKKSLKGNTPEQAAEALELDVSYVSNIMALLEDNPGKSNEEIAMKIIIGS